MKDDNRNRIKLGIGLITIPDYKIPDLQKYRK